MNLEKSLEQFFVRHNMQTQQLVLGLSGGIDSVVLLDLLIKSSYNKEKILAVHVNHGISESSLKWQNFCSSLCNSYQVTFISEQVELTELGLGLEGAARKARYQALSKYVTSASVLLTAQHQDDQCETLLLALKRGSGVLGLAGMLPLTKLSVGEHARPLLDSCQQMINDYATANSLTWVEDDSNSNTHFDRNFLRHDVITKLNERWPSFSANVARSAALCQQQQALSQEIAQSDFLGNKQLSSQLSIALLNQLSDARINNLIRYWLTINGVTLPSLKQLEQIKSQCLSGRDDANPLIEMASFQVRRYLSNLYITDDHTDTNKMTIECGDFKDLKLPNNLGMLSFNQPNDDMSVIAPEGHQRVTIEFGLAGSHKAWPVNRHKRRTLKKLWQEYKIPPWQRSNIAYLCYDEVLVAAIGYWVETDFFVEGSKLGPDEKVLSFTKFH
jgi:tRNA(Ile)-lysidine synthase